MPDRLNAIVRQYRFSETAHSSDRMAEYGHHHDDIFDWQSGRSEQVLVPLERIALHFV